MKIIKPKYGVQKFQSHYVYLNMRKIIAEHLLMVYLRLKRLFFFRFQIIYTCINSLRSMIALKKIETIRNENIKH